MLTLPVEDVRLNFNTLHNQSRGEKFREGPGEWPLEGPLQGNYRLLYEKQATTIKGELLRNGKGLIMQGGALWQKTLRCHWGPFGEVNLRSILL